MKLAILLTASIRVQVVGGNFSVDERKNMYSSTLRYYSLVIGKRYPIIFLENSDFDIQKFRNEFDDLLDIEWIQLRPEYHVPFVPEKGKGYNEYLMIKEGVLRSEKLKTCTHFFKINGRYSMLNIADMIQEIEHRAKTKVFMGDIKDTHLYEQIGLKTLGHWGDSRFWVAEIEYYKHSMADCYREMDDRVDGKWAEHYLLRLARKNRQDERFIFRFHHQVRFNGVSGTLSSTQLLKDLNSQNNIKNRIQDNIRQILRYIFPDIWF